MLFFKKKKPKPKTVKRTIPVDVGLTELELTFEDGHKMSMYYEGRLNFFTPETGRYRIIISDSVADDFILYYCTSTEVSRYIDKPVRPSEMYIGRLKQIKRGPTTENIKDITIEIEEGKEPIRV